MITVAYTKKGYCTAALGTMTAAQKAMRALAARGIFAEIVGLSANETRRGCAFGVSFDCDATEQVRTTLRGVGIPVTQYLRRGGTP